MHSRRTFLWRTGAVFGALAFGPGRVLAINHHATAPRPMSPAQWRALSDTQWHARLDAAQFDVLRRAGTEAPYSSALLAEHRRGTFVCGACALALFDASTKFDSHTGWPSFYRALPHGVETRSDTSLPGDARTEVRCARCESHLGHVFDDGPPPTGLRYCMNGVALAFHANER